MKLSKSILLFMVFMQAPAFKGLQVILAMLFDAVTTSNGVAPFVFKRMGLVIGTGGLAEQSAVVFAVGVSVIFSVVLILSVVTANIHGKRMVGLILSMASFIISFVGVSRGIFDGVGHIQDISLTTLFDLLMCISFAGAPVIYVNLNAGLLDVQFGKRMMDIVTKKSDLMQDIIEDLYEKKFRLIKADAGLVSAKELSKVTKKTKRYTQNTETKTPEKGTVQISTDIDKAIKELENRLN